MGSPTEPSPLENELKFIPPTCPHLNHVHPDKLKKKSFLAASSCVDCLGPAKQKYAKYSKGGGGGGGGKKGGGNKKGQKGKREEEDETLYVCATCGYMGCGRSSPWKHAENHFKSTKHAIAVQWEPRTLLTWCYECDDEVLFDESPAYRGLRDCLTILQGGQVTTVPEEKRQAREAREVELANLREKRKQQKELDQMEKFQKKLQQEQTKRDQKEKQKQQPNFDFESSSSSSSSGKERGVKGLTNLGNTCFFNSVVQNLAHTRQVLSYYMKENEPTVVSGGMNLAFQEVLSQFWTVSGKGSKFSPSSLFAEVCRKFAMFRSRRQQDAHELLCCLFDGLSSEEKGNKRQFTNTTFGGKLASTVTCHVCETASRTSEPFFILSLPIPVKTAASAGSAKEDMYAEIQKAKKEAYVSAKQKRKMEKELRQAQKQKRAEPEFELVEKTEETATEESKPEATSDTTTTTETPNATEEPKQPETEPTPDKSDNTEPSTPDATDSASTSTKPEPKTESPKSPPTTNTTNINKKPSEPIELRKWTAPPARRVGGTLSVQDCILAFTDPEILEGQNAFGCLECTKRARIANNDLTEETEEPEPEPEEVPLYVGPMTTGNEVETSEEDPKSPEPESTTTEASEPEAEVEVDQEEEEGYSKPKSRKSKREQKKEAKNTNKKEHHAEEEAEEEEKPKKKDRTVKSTATKQFLVGTLPPVLILHLKRFMQFKGGLQKMGENVSYPLILDMTPFCDTTAAESQPQPESTPAEEATKESTSAEKPGSSESAVPSEAQTETSTNAKEEVKPEEPTNTETATASETAQTSSESFASTPTEPNPTETSTAPAESSSEPSTAPTTTESTTASAPTPSTSEPPSSSKGRQLYRLYGLVEHSGSMNGGHYVAYTYNDVEDKWYYASDTHVSLVSLESVLKSEAYMLFYHKIDIPK